MEIQSIKNRFGIIGNSSALNHAISIAEKVAATDLTVLISGESGVGKEIFSHIIHQLGARKHNPFIAVNCGAIPEGTIDSELFGHEKGSFTGAQEARKGYFETVNGGTIFLDEIAELPHGTQSRLLRVLESGEYLRVGSSKVLKTDVRVVAASNVNLQEAVRAGKFREDLYYRLSTVPIYIPPLRSRDEDILLLFRKFTSDFSEKNRIPTIKLTEDAKELILKYPWPGNVRQLKNVAEQISILAADKDVSAKELVKIVPDITDSRLPALAETRYDSGGSSFTEREILYKLIFDLKTDLNDLKQFVYNVTKEQMDGVTMRQTPSTVSATVGEKPIVLSASATKQPVIYTDEKEYTDTETVDESLSIDDNMKQLIIRAMKKHKNKRKDAAADLGISERTLYRKIKDYKLDLE
ncbi:MAG: sigma-54-dependent Fis family transcriptional regulator [Bacteroidetes bacterium]|nr:sigma-54-dependent Fis family transcriptional regulator [Bacteroidota bacterium]